MKQTTALWKPAWYELDQPLAIGRTAIFYMVASSSPLRFATAIDQDATEVKAEILSIHNSQLGAIIRIDTNGLSYRFYSEDNTFFKVEAEETPGLIENSSVLGAYLTDFEFLVSIHLL